MVKEKPVLLIVDDNKSYIDRLIEMMKENGNPNTVIAANDYAGAIKQIAKRKPGIILLDMNMPGKSGIEVLRFVREGGWNCKVVMVTNHSNASYRKLCMDAGADYFLDKSRDFGQLPSLIEKLNE
ncbi:MAG: response regulator [Sphingobacteriales bacterium]|nr:response regulator [Sphingobacteriales bacterium]